MNGVHDMGGMDGFGPVQPQPNEPVFHAPWEGRVFALTRALGYAGLWTTDFSRARQEKLPPATYLAASYYQRWELGFENLLVDHDLVTPEELAAGQSLSPGKPLPRTLARDAVQAAQKRPRFGRPPQAPAKFAIGDRVLARNIHPAGHTRLPRYVRGHLGTVERIHGAHVFPDSLVARRAEDPQWLYTVVFQGTDLWGTASDPTVTVSIDAFEPYLEPA
jgi:nitrile hydratase beta subunit